MEERYLVKPDTKFVKELVDLGGESVKKCFQCGTCSVVCALSPPEKPFPRKEMIWAQWGLKDRLIKDPDIWLCHQCTDCSTRCPRGAKPGDVLSALRAYTISRFSRPRFMAKAALSPGYLPVLLGVPALLLFAFFWIATGSISQFPPLEIISPEELFSYTATYVAMGLITAFFVIVLGVGIAGFWRNFRQSEVSPAAPAEGNWLRTWVAVVMDILKHRKWGKCDENKVSRYSHLALFYGAILLLIATGLSALLNHVFGIYSPHPLVGPVKIAGNLGALLFLGGLVFVIARRLSPSGNIGRTGYFDWFLVWTLLFITLTGILTEVIRLMGMATATYWLYMVHLWLMFVFFLYLPFSKAAHMFYRTVALAFARQRGRVEG
jgi:quinone-modifying oxidoreductase subunit QmoC